MLSEFDREEELIWTSLATNGAGGRRAIMEELKSWKVPDPEQCYATFIGSPIRPCCKGT